MSKVIFEMTISLDGYVTGPDVRPEEPMGDGGERLHDWMFAGKSQAEVETFLAANFSEIGAVIVGRRMADLGIGPWGEEPVFHAPCFVLTHRPAETIEKKGGTSYVFVTDGIEAALERARQAAGSQDVQVEGGADVGRQFLNAGLLDGVSTEVRLVPRGAQNAPPAVTHLIYDVECPLRSFSDQTAGDVRRRYALCPQEPMISPSAPGHVH